MRKILITTVAAAGLALAGAAAAQSSASRTGGNDPSTRTDDHELAHPADSIAGESKAEKAAREAREGAMAAPAAADMSAGVTVVEPYPDPVAPGAAMSDTTSAGTRSYAAVGATTRTVANAPIPDSAETRSMYPPLSNGGRRTPAREGPAR